MFQLTKNSEHPFVSQNKKRFYLKHSAGLFLYTKLLVLSEIYLFFKLHLVKEVKHEIHELQILEIFKIKTLK